jgi:hypothetical protein
VGDNIDRKVFEEMVQITDPFDPLFAPKVGKTAEATNKELQDKWMEENVVKLIAPDLSRAPLMTLRGGKSLFSKKAFEAYQKALDRLRKVVKWGDVKGTVRVHDIASKGKGPHYRSDPEQYFTDKEWSKLELGEYRDMFAKFIREERKAVGIGKTRTPKKAADPFDYLDKNLDRLNKQKLRLIDDIKRSEIKQAGYKHDIFPEYESEFSSGTLIDYIEELRKLQN